METDKLKYWLSDEVYKFLRMLVLDIFPPAITLASSVAAVLGVDILVPLAIAGAIATFIRVVMGINAATGKPVETPDSDQEPNPIHLHLPHIGDSDDQI